MIRSSILCLVLFLLCNWTSVQAQESEIPILNFDELQAYLAQDSYDTYVINFWATWCKPCVDELHYFEDLHNSYNSDKFKVLLVSLDFKKSMQTRLIPFVEYNKMNAPVVLLSDPNTNTWISQVAESWDGVIPATWILYKNKETEKIHIGAYDSYQELLDEIGVSTN